MNENKTARLTALKIENRRLILGSIKGNTSCSDISRKTGLSYTCVVTLIDELIREEVLIKTSAEVTTGVGRRPIWVKFNPRKNIVCVISFVGRYSFQLCDLDGTVLYAEPQNFETLPISRGKIEAFTDKIDRLLKTEFADCTLRNINVAAPGRYDKATGETVLQSDNIAPDTEEYDNGLNTTWEKTAYSAVTIYYTNEKIYIYYAADARQSEAHPDEGEFVDSVYVSAEEAYEMIREGKIRDAKTILAVQRYLLETKGGRSE